MRLRYAATVSGLRARSSNSRWAVVHVDDPRVRMGGRRHLVHVPARRQPRADVDQLPDSRLAHQVADRAAHKGAIDPGGFAYIRQICCDLFGRIPIGLKMVFAAEEIVINPR